MPTSNTSCRLLNFSTYCWTYFDIIF